MSMRMINLHLVVSADIAAKQADFLLSQINLAEV